MGRQRQHKDLGHYTIDIERHLVEELQTLSRASGIPMRTLVAEAIRAHLDAAIAVAIAKLQALQEERK